MYILQYPLYVRTSYKIYISILITCMYVCRPRLRVQPIWYPHDRPTCSCRTAYARNVHAWCGSRSSSPTTRSAARLMWGTPLALKTMLGRSSVVYVHSAIIVSYSVTVRLDVRVHVPLLAVRAEKVSPCFSAVLVLRILVSVIDDANFHAHRSTWRGPLQIGGDKDEGNALWSISANFLHWAPGTMSSTVNCPVPWFVMKSLLPPSACVINRCRVISR